MNISVIIPIYNVDKYLRQCIDSVLDQSYNDFEILLVNDGSTDRSEEICNEYAYNEKRIKVFHIENSGASNARNFGLKNAKGKWVCFVDSDDVLLPDYLSCLASDAQDSDFVIHGMTILQTTNNSKQFIVPKRSHKGIPVRDSNILNAVPALCLASPISKLFKNSIIKDNHILYNPAINIGEDYLFVLDYMTKITKISIRSQSNYVYVRRLNSLSTTYNTFDEEILAEDLLYKGTVRFYRQLGYANCDIQKLYFNEFKKHAYRVLFSLYKNRYVTYNRSERIKLFESLSEIQLRRFRVMFRDNGVKGFIISKAFSRSMFRYLDIVLKTIIKK